MRIPSGKTDQNIYFVAFDSSDHTTRKAGLTGFTVYRSRNGGAATAYTTPTVTELSSSNMPGVYAILVDEDTTIASGSDSEEYAVHITASGMDPVSRTIEIYRRDVTSGQTAAVDSSGRVDVGKIGGTAQTARDIGASVLLSPGTGTGQISLSSGAVTVGTNSDKTGYALTAAYDAAKTAAQAGDAMTLSGDFTATMKASLNAATPAVTVSDKTGFKLASDGLSAVTAWTVAVTGDITGNLSGSVGSVTGLTVSNLDVAVSTRLAGSSYAAPLDAAGVRSAVGLASANLDTQLDALPTNAELATALAGADDETLAAIAALNNVSAADVKAQADAALADVGLTTTVTGRIDADVSSRLATSGYTAPDNAGIAAVKAKTDNLPATPAATGDTMTLTAAYDAAKSAASQASVDDLPTNAEFAAAIEGVAPASDVAAIKAKTDGLTFTVAGELDANIKAVNDVTVAGLGTTGSPWGPA